ncbi:MAG TPA: NUDIX domain-containing protein [Patescibacteria group bacterium]|nr:NUDIX domain-containing protein [Patescibacteria group bacterium]
MVNSDELLCVVDEYDNPIQPRPRHEVFKKGHWRRTAHVWIINSKNQVLCQQRSLKKDMSPGMWEAAVSGHLSPGDDYFSGAVREVEEETGLKIKKSDLNLIKIYKDHKSREYRGIFYCKLDVKTHQIKSEADEVEKVKLIHFRTVKKYLKSHPSWISDDYQSEVLSIFS